MLPPSGSPTPITSQDLRLGLEGPDVIAWRRWLDRRGLLGMAPVPASGTFDAVALAATRRMQNTLGIGVDGVVGDVTRAHAMGWPGPDVKGDDGTPAWEDGGLSLGARAVRWILQFAGREDLENLGPNSSAEIATWLRPATRRATGAPLGLVAGEWCAAVFCAAAEAVAQPGEAIPHGYRAAGVELMGDAKDNGLWRPIDLARSGSYAPAEGDGCLLQRSGAAWDTHTCRVVGTAGSGFWTVGGNEGNTVRLTFRYLTDPTLLGFIASA